MSHTLPRMVPKPHFSQQTVGRILELLCPAQIREVFSTAG